MVGQGEGWPNRCLLFPLHVRMLDEYFEEQMKEIIRMCARHRQTMLFSATMTDEVPQAPGREEGRRGEVRCSVGGGESLAWQGCPGAAGVLVPVISEGEPWGHYSWEGVMAEEPSFPFVRSRIWLRCL